MIPRLFATTRLLSTRRRNNAKRFSFASSATTGLEMSDRCNSNLVHSPFPPIETGPYPPFFEFVTSDWKRLNEKVAVVDGSTGLERTFHDYYVTSTGLASVLLAQMDVNEDGCVAMYCPNHVDYLPVSLAVSLLGAKMTPINPLYTSHELELVMNKSRSSVLIVHTSTLLVAMETARNCSHLKHIVVINDDGQALPAGTVDIKDLLHTRTKKDALVVTNPVVHKQTHVHPFLLPYSSGTTGLPKGVVLTHQNIIANLLQLDRVEGPSYLPGHKAISPLPFFHIYAFTVSMSYHAWKGHTLITMSSRFSLEQFCDLVEKHKPQRAHVVPPILVGLAKSPVVSNYDLSSLELIMSGAAPLSKEVETDVKNRIGCPVKQGWGMSELSPLGCLNSDLDIRSGSIGPLVASTSAKVVDEDGNSLPPNMPGELLIKGPQVMLGYMDEPDKTAECLSESGWLRTGDVAYYDEDGFFYISDRLKELIKVRGYQVPPAELEALLLTHPAVGDCAVINVDCDKSGELPRAYIVLKTTTDEARRQQVTEDHIYEWVKERVAPYKRLDGGIEFTNAIPKSASGKILRRILRDQLKGNI